MAKYRFDSSYEEIVTLHDGSLVRMRLVQPGDELLLREGFEHLSPESRLHRFLAPKPRLSEREVHYLTHIDGINHVAIGAVTVPGSPQLEDYRNDAPHGLGVARFIRLRDRPDVADVAITVIDEVQHKGLGTALLERLIEAARERGVVAFHFDVMTENRPMLALLHDMTPDLHEQVTSGVSSVEIPLDRMVLLLEPSQPNPDADSEV